MMEYLRVKLIVPLEDPDAIPLTVFVPLQSESDFEDDFEEKGSIFERVTIESLVDGLRSSLAQFPEYTKELFNDPGNNTPHDYRVRLFKLHSPGDLIKVCNQGTLESTTETAEANKDIAKEKSELKFDLIFDSNISETKASELKLPKPSQCLNEISIDSNDLFLFANIGRYATEDIDYPLIQGYCIPEE